VAEAIMKNLHSAIERLRVARDKAGMDSPPMTPERAKHIQAYKESLVRANERYPAIELENARKARAIQLRALLVGLPAENPEMQAELKAIGQTLASNGVKPAEMQPPVSPHTPSRGMSR
jgi:hypothetical protein